MPNAFNRLMHTKISSFRIDYSKLNPLHWKGSTFKHIGYAVAILILLAASVITVKDEMEYRFGWGDYAAFGSDGNEEEGACNVYGIELHGELVTYISPENLDSSGMAAVDQSSSDDIRWYIQEAEKDEAIKAILLEIDSYGGNGVAAEEVANALKEIHKPVVAMIRTAGTSAAYWVATGADIIFASALSDVGSIGVSMSYLDYSQQNAEDGLTYNSLSTGKFKDYGDPDKPLTAEERALFLRDISIANDNFIAQVAANRGLEEGNVRDLADGSSWPGQLALENGLIDMIGGIGEVEDYLAEKIGEEAEICWY